MSGASNEDDEVRWVRADWRAAAGADGICGNETTNLCAQRPGEAVCRTLVWSDFYGARQAEYLAVVERDNCQRLPASIQDWLMARNWFIPNRRYVRFGGTESEPRWPGTEKTRASQGEFRASRSDVSILDHCGLARSSSVEPLVTR